MSISHRAGLALSLLLLSVAADGSSTLQPDGRGVVAPDRAFDLEKLDLDVTVGLDGSVSGSARYAVRRLGPGPLVLDQVALKIGEVSADGAAVPSHVEGDKLIIALETARGARSVVSLSWTGTPRTGLHYRVKGRDGASFNHIYSQGEADDNRFWFPGWDHPNDRFAYEGLVHGPQGLVASTNSGEDVVNYLIMIAVGDYSQRGQAPYLAYVPPGTTDDMLRPILDPIPGMMAHFHARTGQAYPWGEYRQFFVERFLYTGMENTGATVQATTMLRPAKLEGTSDWVESVVAHELAHQWFGDLLTCRDWRELWLNEGFATFMAGDWMSQAGGLAQNADNVRGWYAASQDGGPLAGRFFQGEDPPDHGRVYVKGASVLNMLRVMLGEDVFWEGIALYVKRGAHQLVQTDDLRHAMEEVSGAELGWFFQQWVELDGLPDLKVRQRYADGTLTVTVSQKLDEDHARYTLPVELEIGTATGVLTRKVWLDAEDVEIQIPLDAAPTYVAFDPRGGVLAKVDQEQDPGAWTAQLRSTGPYAQLAAIAALGDTDEHDALAALLADTSAPRPLRKAAARALGDQRATASLLPLLRDADDGVRAAVVGALGHGVGTDAVDPLLAVLRGETNTDLAGAAMDALASLDAELAAKEARRVLGRTRDPWEAPLRDAAAGALGAKGTPKDLATLLDPKGPYRHNATLWAAVRIGGRQTPGQAQDAAYAAVARAAEALLGSSDQRERELAVAVLAEVGDDRSVDRLEAFRREETLAGLSEAARDAIKAIQSRAAEPKATPNELEARVDALEKRIDDAESELERWRTWH